MLQLVGRTALTPGVVPHRLGPLQDVCRRAQGKFGGVQQSGNYVCKTFSLSCVHLQPLDLMRLQEGDKQPTKDLIYADVFCFVGVVICTSVFCRNCKSYETGLSIWIYWSVQKNSLFVCINVAEYLAVCVCVCASIHPLAVRRIYILIFFHLSPH